MRILKTPPPEAKELLKEATAALAAQNLIRAFRCEIVRENGIEMTKVRNTQPIELPYGNLPGRWDLHAEWLLRGIPGQTTLVVWRSSIGLSVEGAGVTPDGKRACLVRYDFDNGRQGPGLGPIGRHINVLQPEPLGDHVHYPTFHQSSDAWAVKDILELFQSTSFIEDIAKRLGVS
jgi:hypothetical protein